MPKTMAKKPLTVSLIAVPESTPAVLYGLFEVFASVGVAWPELTGEGTPEPAFDVRLVSPDGRPFTCAMGIPITPHNAVGDMQHTDIIVVADLALPLSADPRGRWPDVAEWVRKQYEAGAFVCSVCTGSILIAEAGLLDGLEATTHWYASALFERYYPAVRLRLERILVPAGPDHRLITGGGASSWEDLALHLVARFCGPAEAMWTAKLFLFGDRSEGQMPYAAMGPPRRHDDAAIAKSQLWVADHYAASHPVARMVERSGLAPRTFKRRFKAATGYAPVDYVQALRIEEAKQLLETTDDPTDEIGRKVGYEDPAFFRRVFKRTTSTTPARYRQRFRAIGAVRGGKCFSRTTRGAGST
jgi:transcriptional regulator GlxA family with amidase domain